MYINIKIIVDEFSNLEYVTNRSKYFSIDINGIFLLIKYFIIVSILNILNINIFKLNYIIPSLSSFSFGPCSQILVNNSEIFDIINEKS
jgi:hypothetical protein